MIRARLTHARLTPAAAFAVTLAVMLAACGGSMTLNEHVLDAETLRHTRCIAVLPFANATRLDPAGMMVANAVADVLLRSGRVNPLAPDEIVQLLAITNTAATPATTAMIAQAYGQSLGVEAVLMGTVTEMGTPRIGSTIKEPVVGFVATIVSTKSGDVVWTATASNYHHSVWLETIESRDALLRAVAQDATHALLADRPTLSGPLGPCATLQEKLVKGELRPGTAAH